MRLTQRLRNRPAGFLVLPILAVAACGALVPKVSAKDAGVAVAPVEAAGGAWWPRWRGPSGQGEVTGGGYPDRWSPTDNVAWKVPVPGTGNTFEAIPTPVVAHDLIFASSGRAGPTLAIRPGVPARGIEPAVVWRSPKGSPFVPSPVVYGELLYMVNDMSSIATCFEAKSGELVWQGRLGEAKREGFSASPVAFDGKVFFTDDDGDTFVLEAGREFRLLHVNRLGERTLATPALVEGRWYFRTERYLLAIEG